MERLILLQAGPFSLNVHWHRSGVYQGLPTLRFFRKEGRTQEALDIHIESTLEEIPPPSKDATVLKGEWSSEVSKDGVTRVLFWCSASQGYVLEVRYLQSFREARIRSLRSYPKHQHLNFLLTSAVRWMVLHRLAHLQGFMLHGAGILHKNGFAIVGTGPSGAGKSTYSSFFSNNVNYEILSDETVIFLRGPDGWRIWGTPWPGMLDVGKNLSGKLMNTYFLEKTQRHLVSPISLKQAFSRLWSEVFVPPANTLASEMILKNVELLLKEIPPKILGFQKNKSVVEFSEHQINESTLPLFKNAFSNTDGEINL